MHGEDERVAPREQCETVDRGGEQVLVVHQRGAVQRDEAEAAGLDGQVVRRGRLERTSEQPQQGVDHRVPDQHDPLVDPFLRQVRDGALRVHEEERADVVGQPPVVLLRHRPVEAPQPRLQMAHPDAELDRGQRRGERRVDVARDDNQVGSSVFERPFDALEGPRRLDGMRAGSDAEEDVWLGQPQLGDEDVGHRRIVVLAGVDEDDLDLPAPESGDERCRLHEVRPGADDDGHQTRHDAMLSDRRGYFGFVIRSTT